MGARITNSACIGVKVQNGAKISYNIGINTNPSATYSIELPAGAGGGIDWDGSGFTIQAYAFANGYGIKFSALDTLHSAVVDCFLANWQGIVICNRTTVEKAAAPSPIKGMMVFDTTLNKLCVWTGAAWETITSM